MGDAKPWYQSKTIVVNLTALAVWVLTLAVNAAQAGELPTELAPYAVLIALVGNVLLRLNTTQPVAPPVIGRKLPLILLCLLAPSVAAAAGDVASSIDVTGGKDRVAFCVPLGDSLCQIVVQVVDGDLQWSMSTLERPVEPIPDPRPLPTPTPQPTPGPSPGPPPEGEFGIAPKIYAAAVLAGGNNSARVADCVRLAKRCRDIATELTTNKSTVRAAGYALVEEMANLSAEWSALKTAAKTELYALFERGKLSDAAAFARLLNECAAAFDAAAAKRK